MAQLRIKPSYRSDVVHKTGVTFIQRLTQTGTVTDVATSAGIVLSLVCLYSNQGRK